MPRRRMDDLRAAIFRALVDEGLSLREAHRTIAPGLEWEAFRYHRRILSKEEAIQSLKSGAWKEGDNEEAVRRYRETSPGHHEGGQRNLPATPRETSPGHTSRKPPRVISDSPYLWEWTGARWTSALRQAAPHLPNNNPYGQGNPASRYRERIPMDGHPFTVQISQGPRKRTALFNARLVFLKARDKWEAVDRATSYAQRAIELTMKRLDVSLRKWPAWVKGPKGRRAGLSVTGEIVYALPPDLQDSLRDLPGKGILPLELSPTAQIDGSGDNGLSWESEDWEEAAIMAELKRAEEEGRQPHILQAHRDAILLLVQEVQRLKQETGRLKGKL